MGTAERHRAERVRDLMGFKKAKGTPSPVLLLCNTKSQDEILTSVGHFWKISTLRARVWAKGTTNGQQGVLKGLASVQAYWCKEAPQLPFPESSAWRCPCNPRNSHLAADPNTAVGRTAWDRDQVLRAPGSISQAGICLHTTAQSPGTVVY